MGKDISTMNCLVEQMMTLDKVGDQLKEAGFDPKAVDHLIDPYMNIIEDESSVKLAAATVDGFFDELIKMGADESVVDDYREKVATFFLPWLLSALGGGIAGGIGGGIGGGLGEAISPHNQADDAVLSLLGGAGLGIPTSMLITKKLMKGRHEGGKYTQDQLDRAKNYATYGNPMVPGGTLLTALYHNLLRKPTPEPTRAGHAVQGLKEKLKGLFGGKLDKIKQFLS